MAETAAQQLARATMRAAAGNVSRMTDEQLIALRGIFQAIDSNNNGSITPALLTQFYQEVRCPTSPNPMIDCTHKHTHVHFRFVMLFLTFCVLV
jgi:Ca2+-binding EF-hand superfamily protein